MFNVGDYVTRNSYNNDIVFKIVDIVEDNYILKGLSIRLYADSYEEDLKLVSGEVKSDFDPELVGYRTLDRNEYFYLPGKVLHIDGDKDYLRKCLEFYKKNKIKAIICEGYIPSKVPPLSSPLKNSITKRIKA